jgi:hypothetical protein
MVKGVSAGVQLRFDRLSDATNIGVAAWRSDRIARIRRTPTRSRQFGTVPEAKG